MAILEIVGALACMLCTLGAAVLLVLEKPQETVSDDRYLQWLTRYVAARVLLTSGAVFLVWALTAPEPPPPDLRSAVRVVQP